jgi:hypothetical protein
MQTAYQRSVWRRGGGGELARDRKKRHVGAGNDEIEYGRDGRRTETEKCMKGEAGMRM